MKFIIVLPVASKWIDNRKPSARKIYATGRLLHDRNLGAMQLRFPQTRRAYVTSLAAGVGTFLFVILIVHGLLTSMGLRAEATYLDDTLVGIAVFLLVLALEAHHETQVRAERERSLLSLGLNHHIRNALQTIVYVSSTVQDEHQAQLLRDAASRIEWAVREVPKQAKADEVPDRITAVGWKQPVTASGDPQKTELPQ